MMATSRRKFTLATATLAAAALTGCTSSNNGGSDSGGNQELTEKRSQRGFIDPPYLADQVKSGKLPPIDERLPEQVFVVGKGILEDPKYDTWQDGRYSGTLNLVGPETNLGGDFFITGGATFLRSPSQAIEPGLPNVLSAWSHSNDLKTYSLTIRKALRWSDGKNVTTEDARFLFEDLYGDSEANFPPPTELYTQRNPDLPPGKLKVIDDRTFEISFARPYGIFVSALNSWLLQYTLLLRPAHYLKQFHGKYADKATLDALVKKNNYKTWPQLMSAKNLDHWNIGSPGALGLPTLNEWVLTKATDQQRILERNPYYWHVDKSGHQLPYFDRVEIQITSDLNAYVSAIMDGQATVAAGDSMGLNNMPDYKQSTEHAGTRVVLTHSFNFPPCLFLNHDYHYDHPNDPWTALVSDPEHRFGKAIAAALDANAINKGVYFGLMGKPMLNTATHDPELAKSLLDQAGMDKMDSEGFRLAPDGTPFTFAITYAAELAPDFAPIAELLKSQFGAVGIRVTSKGVDPTLYDQQAAGNQLMAALNWNDGPNWAYGISFDYGPADKGPWSPATWQYVTTKGKSGRKPPEYIQKFYDIDSTRTQYIPSEPDGKKAYQDLLNWMMDNYAFMPTTGLRVKPSVLKNNVRNEAKDGAPCELDMVINLQGVWLDG